MSTTTRPVRRRLSAAALAFALAGGGAGMALSLAPSAYAAPSPSLIDTQQDVSLAIHKHLGPAGAAGDGTVQSPSGAALQGVDFDVYSVDGVDLKTNAGWATATALQGRSLTPAEVAAGSFTVGATTYTIAPVTTVTTDGTGTAVFDIVVGATSGTLYVVVENLGTSGTITDLSTSTVVDPATLTPLPPFMVTLPMTNPAEDGWLYDVNVYPKNVADTITKEVTDQGSVAGGTPPSLRNISYTLTSSIPDAIPAGELGTYVVNDNLPANVSLTGVTVELGATTLTEGTDYIVYTGADGDAMTVWDGSPVAGHTVSIVFTQTGRDLLQADPSLDVVTTLGATVDSQTTTGVVTNSAQLIPSSSWWSNNQGASTYDPNNPTTTGTTVPTTPVGVPSDPVESRYGDLEITKADAETPATLLNGAEFAVYSAGTDGDCDPEDVDTTATVLATTTGTVGGLVTISGLQASDYYDGQAQTAIRGYCIVETQAPDGYNLLAQPIYREILSADGLGSATPQAVTIENQKTNLGNSLPLTGGAGAAAISVGGLVLVGGGLAYYLVSSRRRDESESA
jgi:LPXTG-motif cell wall-anchored protein